jgi:hypothetical protein
MPTTGSANLRKAVQRQLTLEAGGDVDSRALASAALRAYNTLAVQLAILIGDGGVAALTTRSLHLLQQDFPWLEAQTEAPSAGPFARFSARLQSQPPAIAREAAAAAMATIGGLLEALIGDALTMRVLRAAWPGAFDDDTQQEARSR